MSFWNLLLLEVEEVAALAAPNADKKQKFRSIKDANMTRQESKSTPL